MNAYQKIQQGMRRNEVELLAHIREYRIDNTSRFSMSWHNALDRLKGGRMVRFSMYHRCYVARKGARPVTPAVRRTK